MEYEKFKKIIDLTVSVGNNISQAYKIKIDLMGFCDEYEEINKLLWEEILNENGIDWMSWFLYDKGKREDIKAWDENENEICKDVRGLYDYLTKEGYFK